MEGDGRSGRWNERGRGGEGKEWGLVRGEGVGCLVRGEGMRFSDGKVRGENIMRFSDGKVRGQKVMGR